MRVSILGVLLLAGCSSSMILKQPVIDQCTGTGLKGCDKIADGVLAYVDGDAVTGRAKLIQGAGENDPAQLRQFAAGLDALRELPGMSGQLGSLGEISAILSGGTAAVEPASASGLASAPGSHGPTGTTVAATHHHAQTVSLGDRRRRSCKDTTGEAANCIIARKGQTLVSDLVFEGKCDGAFVAAMPYNVLSAESARWVLRRGFSGGAWSVDPDEAFVIGGPDGTPDGGALCSVSWAGTSD